MALVIGNKDIKTDTFYDCAPALENSAPAAAKNIKWTQGSPLTLLFRSHFILVISFCGSAECHNSFSVAVGAI